MSAPYHLTDATPCSYEPVYDAAIPAQSLAVRPIMGRILTDDQGHCYELVPRRRIAPARPLPERPVVVEKPVVVDPHAEDMKHLLRSHNILHQNLDVLYGLLVRKEVIVENPDAWMAGYPYLEKLVPRSEIHTETPLEKGPDCDEYLRMQKIPPLEDMNTRLLHYQDGRIVHPVSHRIVGRRAPVVVPVPVDVNINLEASKKNEDDEMPPLVDHTGAVSRSISVPSVGTTLPVSAVGSETLPSLVDHLGRVVEPAVSLPISSHARTPSSSAINLDEAVEQPHPVVNYPISKGWTEWLKSNNLAKDGRRDEEEQHEDVNVDIELDSLSSDDASASVSVKDDVHRLSPPPSPFLVSAVLVDVSTSTDRDLTTAAEAGIDAQYVEVSRPSSASIDVSPSSTTALLPASNDGEGTATNFSQVLSELKLQAKTRRERAKSVFEVFSLDGEGTEEEKKEEVEEEEDDDGSYFDDTDMVFEVVVDATTNVAQKQQQTTDVEYSSTELIKLRTELLEARLRLALAGTEPQ